MQRLNLNFAPGNGFACLSELTGHNELAVADTGAADAIRLVDGVLVATADGGIEPGSAARLTAGDRDRLLAAIYAGTYGARVPATLDCDHCGARFDIDFSLEQLLSHQLRPSSEDLAPEVSEAPPLPLGDGTFQLADGTRFRLPTGEDECAVLGLPPEQAQRMVLKRCLIEAGAGGEVDDERSGAVQAAMEALAPVLDLELDARCSECGEWQVVHFDIQHYLLSALQQERGQLAHEIHRLASAYGWSLSEILGLPRSQRRSLVALIEAERAPVRRELT